MNILTSAPNNFYRGLSKIDEPERKTIVEAEDWEGPTYQTCVKSWLFVNAREPSRALGRGRGNDNVAEQTDYHDRTNDDIARGFPADKFYDLMAVSRDAGTAEVQAHEEEFDKFFDRLPKEFIFERELLHSRLWRSPDRWELAPADTVRPAA